MPRKSVFAKVALASLVLCTWSWNSAGQAEEQVSVELAASATYAPARVRADLDVGGDLTLEGEAGPAKLPMSVVGEFSYREQPLPRAASDASPASGEFRSLRQYDQARATIKIDEGGVQPELPGDRRQIVASVSPDGAILMSPTGPLTRDQLDLIDIPAGTHVLDRLLPGRSVTVGDTWKHDNKSIQALLQLDEISVCEVESVLIGVERGYAKLRLVGAVYGKTNDAATEMEVKGGYLFDTQQGRITRMNLAFSEKREAGRVGPAVDVIGKVTLQVDPLPADEWIPKDQLDSVAQAFSKENAKDTRLLVEDDQTGLRFLHDRQWHVTSQGTDRMVLRRVDGGEFIAQCTLSVRPERQEGRQATLAEFERDVRFSLGQRFESLLSTGEWANAAGLLCYRLVVQGNVDGLPVEWRYFLAAPPAGRSVAAAISVEPRFTEQLGEADRDLVESIQLVSSTETKPAASGTSAQTSPAGVIK